MSDKKAFRCKNCGFLHTVGDAGENEYPHSCRVCGKGVTHSMLHHEIDQMIAKNDHQGLAKLAGQVQRKEINVNDQTKTVYPDNWEILADASPARLKELGLAKDQVEAPPQKMMSTDPKRVVGRPFRVFTNEAIKAEKESKSVKKE